MQKYFPILINLVILLFCILSEGIIQHLFIIFSLFLNYVFLFKRLNIGKLLYNFLYFVIFLYILSIYIQYYNSISFGFKDGIVQGFLGENYYDDTAQYYFDAKSMYHIFTHKNAFIEWTRGDTEYFSHYGPYNLFNIFNGIIILIFGYDMISMILIKLYFFIFSLYYLYYIIEYFKLNKHSFVFYILYVIFPARIYSNILLLRDNIIEFFIILIFYIYIKLINNKEVKYLFLLFICWLIIILFRTYNVIIPLLLIFHYVIFVYRNYIINKILLFFIALSFLIVIIYYFYGIDRLILNLLQYSAGSLAWNAERATGINIILFPLYYNFYSNMLKTDLYNLFFIQDLLTYLSSIYLNVILLLCTIACWWLLFNRYFKLRKEIFIFGLLFPVLYLILHSYTFGGIIPRIYLTWNWINIIIIIFFYNRLKNMKMLIFIIAFIAVIIFRFVNGLLA